MKLSGSVHAEFLNVVSLGSKNTITFGIWRRHSDFLKLAKKVITISCINFFFVCVDLCGLIPRNFRFYYLNSEFMLICDSYLFNTGFCGIIIGGGGGRQVTRFIQEHDAFLAVRTSTEAVVPMP